MAAIYVDEVEAIIMDCLNLLSIEGFIKILYEDKLCLNGFTVSFFGKTLLFVETFPKKPMVVKIWQILYNNPPPYSYAMSNLREIATVNKDTFHFRLLTLLGDIRSQMENKPS